VIVHGQGRLHRPGAGGTTSAFSEIATESIDMSADKDRGIRRIKQKRAKEQKKQAREQRSAGAARGTAAGGAPPRTAA